jgi:uncharacterized protein (DUF488 family)
VRRGFTSVGYEGRSLDEFIAALRADEVTVVADVRLNAVSRRRGFSKTALRNALEAAGIRYVHLRALGNPPENRAGFHANDPEPAKARFAQLLNSSTARAELRELASLGNSDVVAVLCVERDPQRCHRTVVIDAVRRLP